MFLFKMHSIGSVRPIPRASAMVNAGWWQAQEKQQEKREEKSEEKSEGEGESEGEIEEKIELYLGHGAYH